MPLVVLLGFLARRALTKDTEDHVPTKLQLIWEAVVGQVNKQVEDNLGKVHPYAAPLAISLFFFILFANWLEILPTELNHDVHLLPAPTADTNLTYALAAVTIVSVWVYGIRQKGAEGLPSALPRAVPRDAPAQRARGAHQADHAGPATLRQHLRRRHHAGADHPDAGLRSCGRPTCCGRASTWRSACIQAFIFALLTVLYFAMAGAGHGDDHGHDDEDADQDDHVGHDEAASVEPTPVPAS